VMKAVRFGLLAERVNQAGDGEVALSVDDIQIIESQLSGQTVPMVWGVLRIIDPGAIEKLR
jgi:DNA-binding transcriptional regulator YdaS (Cro superfamily)